MPLSVQQLASQRVEFTWDYLGEQLQITYNPQGMTPAIEKKINEATEGNASAAGLVYLLRVLLVDWDLTEPVPLLDEATQEQVVNSNGDPLFQTDADGNELQRPFGTDEEKMMALPTKFLSDAILKIAREIQELSAEGKP